jgi:DNA-binding protein H-NS
MSKKLLDLQKKIEGLEAEKRILVQRERKKIIDEVGSLIMLYGITKTELTKFFSSDGTGLKSKAPTKERFTYKNPETGETWVGNVTARGRRPNWVRELIADKKIEECRVPGANLP